MLIAGTERGAFNPFFSPDGEWLAFFTPTELKKVSLSGGSPIKIAAVPPVTQGGAWSPDGTIVFAQINGGLSRVSASGGAPAALTTPDASAGERAHSWPQILPGGKELLLVVRAGTDFQDVAHSNIAVHSLETGKRRVLVQGATFGQWVSPGYLLFLRGTTLLAAPCAPGSWELTGPPMPVMENVLVGSSDGFPYLAASGSGLLVFATGGFVERDQDTVLWIDRAGHEEALPLPPGAYHTPRLSPDGRHLAVVFIPPGLGARVAIWIYDLDRKALSPLTPEPGRYFCPVWSPDGKRVVFARFETGEPTMAWKSADGSGTIERLSPSATPEFPTSWSPDGRAIAYTAATSGKENMDVWLLSLGPKRERRPWLATPFREFAPFLSPDGRFLAYVSNESGRHEVYVRPVAGEGKTRISIDGGAEPAWSPDGRELFYRSGEKLFSVPVQTSPEVSAGQARLVLTGSLSSGAREDYPRNWEISPDGKRFLFVREQGSNPPRIGELQLFANWRSAVERASSR
jgi:serine/threonine-protein kinase